MIVALGDSTTAGTPGWMSPREFPPKGRGDDRSQYAYWLMHAHPEWTVVNQGINGQRSDEIARRFDEDVAALRPSLVIIIAGVNDIYQGRPAAHVIAQLDTMYRRAAALGIRVVAGTILPYNTATPDQNARMREVNAWITARAESDPNMRVADTRVAVASATDPDRLASTPDDLHPDADGYRRMAAAIEPQIEGHRKTQKNAD
ncbi:MAG TPA: GDSL-type esterase/lipase family protein [Gemmatimonadaceae bacterium]|nr:GDSL-type esterase/lipase family protein [Vicinamibacterales bacterium]